MRRCQTLSISIARPPGEVAAAITDYPRLAEWLSFITGVREAAGCWYLDTPQGAMRIEFVPANDLGVVDHWVVLPDGQRFYNPMRVVANDEGSEVLFTLFQSPEMSDEQFAADVATITVDLTNLRRLLTP